MTDRQTDRRTDRQTDKQTFWSIVYRNIGHSCEWQLEAFESIKSTPKLKATHRRIFCFCTQLRSTVRMSSSLRIDTFSVYIIASYCPPPHPHVLERDCTPGRIGMDGSHAVKAWESTTLDCTTSAFAASRLSLTRSAQQIDARFARKKKIKLKKLFYKRNTFKQNVWK